MEEGALNVLLMGSDLRTGKQSDWRTDTIIIAAVRPQSGYLALFSIPRDLWVTIPGHGKDRINTADYRGEVARGSGGGPALLAATLQENLGIPVHSYVRIRFEGLVQIIDALGGVTVTVDRVYHWQSGSGPDARVYLHLEPGRQKLDGRTALLYARDRTYSTDFDRSRRQQEILLAMRQAALQPAVVTQLPRLLGALPDVVQTNLSPAQITSLANLALRLKPEAIRTRTFDTTMVESWVAPNGAMVLLPRRDRIEQAWREVTAAQ